MKNTLLCMAALVAALLSSVIDARGHTSTSSPSLTVSIFNDAAIPQLVLLEAKERATLTMRQSGIHLQWLDCGSPGARISNSGCNSMVFPQHFSVRLVSQARPPKADVFGQCFQDEAGEGNYVVVYYPELAASPAAHALRSGDLLGLVISHELGHLLLGKDSHSRSGLMAAVWQESELRQAARGNLFFSSEQADRMSERYLTAAARLRKLSAHPQSSTGK